MFVKHIIEHNFVFNNFFFQTYEWEDYVVIYCDVVLSLDYIHFINLVVVIIDLKIL